MPTIQEIVSTAIKAAHPPMEDLAERLGLSSSALRRYRLGNRVPTPDTVDELVRALRLQAAQLVRVADRLERVNANRRDSG